MRVIGIDPGLSGAIAILEDKKVLSIFDMPVMAEGKKNKRRSTKESDWRTYWGSSDHLNEDVEQLGPENFTREILYYCTSRGELSYLEAKEQFDREVLKTDEYYNGIINVRVGSSKALTESLNRHKS